MTSRTPLILALAPLLAAFACDPGPVAPRDAAVTPAAPAPVRSARRGRLLAGERVARVPRWPAPAQIDQTVRARLPARARALAPRLAVPVLVPSDPGWLTDLRLYDRPGPDGGEDLGYALAAGQGEVRLTMRASREATLLPHVTPARGTWHVRGVDGFVSANDGIMTAAWIEHGVAYSLDLECYRRDDPACDEAALRAAVDGLVYVGGAGEAPQGEQTGAGAGGRPDDDAPAGGAA